MEVAVFLFLASVAFFALPFILSFAHARQIRQLRADLERLSGRLGLLESETRGGKSPAPAAAKAAPAQPPPIPIAAPPPVPAVSIPRSITEPASSGSTARQGDWGQSPLPARAPINWEAFMGIKLFAWIGGFALFLGIVFLVKYSFENNLVRPRARITIGAIAGAALIVIGWLTATRRYRVSAQTLCATGILVLYADIFAAHEFYNLISLTLAFILMSGVTLLAFGLALRLDAQVVVVLGLLGGFLTPVLLATGRNNAAALFGYIALLDIGVAAIALRKRWEYLVVLAALGTVLTQFRWAVPYFDIPTVFTGLVIFLGFQALFLAIVLVGKFAKREENWSAGAGCIAGFVAQTFSFSLLFYPQLKTNPLILFLWVFLSDIGLLALARSNPRFVLVAELAGSIAFAVLALWTAIFLNLSLFWWALGGYLLFALLHSGFFPWSSPTAKRGPALIWIKGFTLLLVAFIAMGMPRWEVSFAAWLSILLFLTVGIGLVLSTPALLAMIGGLFMAIVAANGWFLFIPRAVSGTSRFATSLMGFGMFLLPALIFAGRSLRSSVRAAEVSGTGGSAFGSLMPFVLLLIAVGKITDLPATPAFAPLFLFAVLLLGVSVARQISWPGAVVLAGTWAIECAWHALHFSPGAAILPLGWYIVILILFVAYPYFCADKADALPWATSAIAAVMQFWLIYQVVATAYPNAVMGLLAMAFVIPPAIGIYYLVKSLRANPGSGDARIAWLGGAALLFLSLIFPIQFDREWITLGWALEGVALLFLFRVVPNRGLRLVAAALLCLAFVRLAFNPAVLEYHKRAPVPIWNWYLYAYGITSLCLLAGGKLFEEQRTSFLERKAPIVLYALGGILVFLLLNIEIADYFSIGPTLTFAFSGNFARDMTYSIAWALYAFVLLVIGMRRKVRAVRYAGLALIALTLAKLFLHDLGALSQLYRIGAFIGVAVILIVVSFIYQRFLAPAEKEAPDLPRS